MKSIIGSENLKITHLKRPKRLGPSVVIVTTFPLANVQDIPSTRSAGSGVPSAFTCTPESTPRLSLRSKL